ncbi:hypothetical protein QNI16_27405 [Cytophagaceae bacterium YF14B1]|uniref:Uncharacterized protein n=1 Tax=Xanthocytophaga flava TaxID=3048013 RepID=A0AAE3QVX1_9BACT|nr:hypothetical protein [Xanthocytophaga flavus]MDJ1484255.1 hypothetical protein [Xanthocytophaga flavus]
MSTHLNINLYPSFTNVFADNTLKGIFYPLCTVENKNKYPNHLFHFVSSNGLWMNEDYVTKENNTSYTLFDIVDRKYHFAGDVRLYKGYAQAQLLFPRLEAEFEQNGKDYLKNRIKTKTYISILKQTLTPDEIKDFDIDYFLQTFYEYSINKLYFQLYGSFAKFRSIIDGWASNKTKSPVVYPVTTKELDYILGDSVQSATQKANHFDVLGRTAGEEFFTDGNDTVLLYDVETDKVLCWNFYS